MSQHGTVPSKLFTTTSYGPVRVHVAPGTRYNQGTVDHGYFRVPLYATLCRRPGAGLPGLRPSRRPASTVRKADSTDYGGGRDAKVPVRRFSALLSFYSLRVTLVGPIGPNVGFLADSNRPLLDLSSSSPLLFAQDRIPNPVYESLVFFLRPLLRGCAELLEDAELVGASPTLDHLAVAEACDLDAACRYPPSGGCHPEELTLVRAGDLCRLGPRLRRWPSCAPA